MKILITLYLLVATVCSCHGVRRIAMQNKSNDTAEIIWTLNEDSLANNPFLISNSKELKFTLFPPKTKEIKMSFGPGNWSPTQVQKLVGFLESLEIKSAKQRIKIDSLPLLKDYLLARRKGIGGATISIEIE
jgi:hypothetical protein